MSYQDGSKDMTAAEAATAAGKNRGKQPFDDLPDLHTWQSPLRQLLSRLPLFTK